ncbi:NUDIX hydrolase [Elizabethkingia ursingii]|uniref:NUDIX hydrolase n=1 Tax=Elizabethkingia ursingii TaxID=1756150 RepID=UPI0007507AE0|nr:NUDIX domain-containing protein [Elizabethkingia ursingii]KUY31093.1 NUDIX hydrolase [Elizabethkingia ursingii]
MYKVFINERKLSFTNAIQQIDKNLEFVDVNTFSIAIDLLENTSTPSVNIYAENVEEVWNTFSASFRNIEAAGGVVLNTKDEVLFIYRMSRWDLPKGKMEKGESKDLTALREVEEECSITDLSLEEFLSSTYHMYTERDGSKVLKVTHWYKMRHHSNQQPLPQEIEGITKAEWKPQSDIKTEVFPNTFQNIRLILDEALDLE